MTRFGRLLGLIVALSGFAAAHVLVQAGSAMQLPAPPTVSVTVPTVSVPTPPLPPVPPPTTPTVPAPPLPTPTVPLPPPPAPTVPPPPPPAQTTAIPLPAVTTPRTSRPPATTSPTPPPVSLPAGGTSSPSGSSTAAAGSRGEQGRTGTPRSNARSGRLEATKLRTKNRVSVRLEFKLPRADRVFLIVRGPSPSCRIAGYIPVRGHKGSNKVAFAGRVHGRRLDPGVYLISVSPNRRLDPGAPTEYVRVVSPRRSLPLPDSARKPSCNEANAFSADPIARNLVGEATRPTASLAGLPTASPLRPPLQGGSATNDAAEGDDGASGFLPDGGVLGEVTGGGDATIVVLTFIGALLVAMLALVTRFLRGSWNP